MKTKTKTKALSMQQLTTVRGGIDGGGGAYPFPGPGCELPWTPPAPPSGGGPGGSLPSPPTQQN